jgi:hypothetical protein
MATEQKIKTVLDLLTIAPVSHVESLGFSARSRTSDLKNIIDQKNIVAVGISEKVSGNEKTGKLALTFYVEKKIPLNRLKGNEVIPPTIPESISGAAAIPTDVVVTGKLRLEGVNKTRSPLQPGNSIGHFNITAGTFGAVVTDGKDYFILSNSHVLADSGRGKKGDVILYPGKYDGGKNPADKIGVLQNFIPFKTGSDFVNEVDCAIASIDPEKIPFLLSQIKGLSVPKGIVNPRRGMQVVKVGRTSGKTVGEIRDVNFRTTINYGTGIGTVGFLDQIYCTRYTKGGDSGSLVLESSSNKAVGLHFAGSDDGSIFNPITSVLDALKMQLVIKEVAKGLVPSSAATNPKKRRAKKRLIKKRT